MDGWPTFRRTLSYFDIPRDLVLTIWERLRGYAR